MNVLVRVWQRHPTLSGLLHCKTRLKYELMRSSPDLALHGVQMPCTVQVLSAVQLPSAVQVLRVYTLSHTLHHVRMSTRYGSTQRLNFI